MQGEFSINFSEIDGEGKINVKKLGVGDITRFNNMGKDVEIVVKGVSPCEDPEDVLVKAVTLSSNTLFSELEDIQFRVPANTMFSFIDHAYDNGILFSEIDNDDPINLEAKDLEVGNITTIKDNDTRRDILITDVDKSGDKVVIEAKVLDGSNEVIKCSVSSDAEFSVKDFFDSDTNTLFSDRTTKYTNFNSYAAGSYVYDPQTRGYVFVPYGQQATPQKKGMSTGAKIALGALGVGGAVLGANALMAARNGDIGDSWAVKGGKKAIDLAKKIPGKLETKKHKEERLSKESAAAKAEHDEKYTNDPKYKAEYDRKDLKKSIEAQRIDEKNRKIQATLDRQNNADLDYFKSHGDLDTVDQARSKRVDESKAAAKGKLIEAIKSRSVKGSSSNWKTYKKAINKDGTLNTKLVNKNPGLLKDILKQSPAQVPAVATEKKGDASKGTPRNARKASHKAAVAALGQNPNNTIYLPGPKE